MEESEQNKIYLKYINSEEWIKKSKKWILEEGKCERCKGGHKLTCHHKHYSTMGFEKRRDIIVLCWECHKKYHRKDGVRIFTREFDEKIRKIRRERVKLDTLKTLKAWKNKIEKEEGWELT